MVPVVAESPCQSKRDTDHIAPTGCSGEVYDSGTQSDEATPSDVDEVRKSSCTLCTSLRVPITPTLQKLGSGRILREMTRSGI